MFTALAMQAHRGSCRQRDIGHPDANQFGDSSTCIVEHAEHGGVAAPAPGRHTWGSKQRVNFVARQKLKHGPFEAFHRYRNDLLCKMKGWRRL